MPRISVGVVFAGVISESIQVVCGVVSGLIRRMITLGKGLIFLGAMRRVSTIG
jgi:hypothetical protein